ncbi:NAD(P)H-dependent glycerol-3-phosphate dehydrogenase [Plastoroseomonas arctica]|uniref:Glycerol-3-phosphate dehydrogenase [NAD(P)+] n=1 Tax=Plastoroseomonas arctica TaxID=1509237 RepID=A0AAF1K1N9_9PROT|nr:NAD(P)H-dependent glycerol-3-phosphate dehydrogenase [Plastoroseomonas arctica]MBR0657458.1 NAD(P)H-dependent glycerol-3-phosphate dehydrogenase [Plastoroseomonas arctica]
MARVAVLGAGAWGTALALQALRAGADVALWARDPGRAAAMVAAGENTRYLPGLPLPPALRVTADPLAALEGAALILLVVPVQGLRGVLSMLPDFAAPVLLCAKGVEAASGKFPLEILAALRPGAAGILTGPNFAAEVARGLPAAAVIASADAGLRATALTLLAGPGFRLYGNDDAIGAQVGGAAKNVIAIAAGAVIGAGLGENARAALVTRGLAELSRLTVALGGRAETAAGLSGLGDLVLTTAGTASRNMSLGMALGRGQALTEILAGRAGVTEGVATAPALVARARAAGVELPLCEAVAELLQGSISLPDAISRLMARPLRDE